MVQCHECRRVPLPRGRQRVHSTRGSSQWCDGGQLRTPGGVIEAGAQASHVGDSDGSGAPAGRAWGRGGASAQALPRPNVLRCVSPRLADGASKHAGARRAALCGLCGPAAHCRRGPQVVRHPMSGALAPRSAGPSRISRSLLCGRRSTSGCPHTGPLSQMLPQC